ncbi:MAG: MFS transporter [Candidatus Acidiferrales bacterium]
MSGAQISSAPGTGKPTSLSGRAQWVATMCGCIVAFAYSANYTNHAPLVPALRLQFGFNQALAGLLTTGIFATHAATQIPGGHIVDRFGAKRVLLAALVIVAIGNLGMASAQAYWQLLFFKIFTGLGTGVCFVGGARYIHAAAAGPRLNVSQGLFGGSIQLGAGFVIFAVPRLSLYAGWRITFLVSAGMALLAAGIWMAGAPDVAFPEAPPGQLHKMLLAPQLWLLGTLQMVTFGFSVVVGAWVVVFLKQIMKIPATQAGLIGSLVLLLGIVARPLGGYLRQHMGIRPILFASVLMITIGCFSFTSSSLSLGVAWTAVILLGMGTSLPYAAMFSRAGALFPGRAGAAMGLVNMLGIIMILAGAPLVGHLADITGNFRTSFEFLGGCALLACLVIPLIERDEPVAHP